jgi:GAF domain-containing protein
VPLSLNKQLARALASDGKGRVYVGALKEFGYLERDSRGQWQYASLMALVPQRYRQVDEVWNVTLGQDGVYFNAGQYLYRYRPTEPTIKVWEAQGQPFHLLFGVNGRVFVRHRGVGLLEVQGDELKLVPGGEQWTNDLVYVMLPYDAKRILVGARGRGLFLMDELGFTPFKTELDERWPHLFLYLPGAVLPNGLFAINTYGQGIFVIDRQGRLVQHFDKASGLRDNSVSVLFADRDGDLWAGTANGISRFDLSSPMRYFDSRLGLNSSVLSLARHGETVYVGAESGLHRVDPVNGTVGIVPDGGLQIQALLPAGPEVLVGSSNGVGVIRNGRVNSLVPNPNGDRIGMAFEARMGQPQQVWVATNAGLGLLQKGRGPEGWQWLGLLPDFNMDITSMLQDERGRVWLSSDVSGAARLSFEPGAGMVVRKQELFGSAHGWPEGGRLVRWGPDVFVNSVVGLKWWNEGQGRFESVGGLGERPTSLYAVSTQKAFLTYGVASHLSLAQRGGQALDWSVVPAPELGAIRDEYINMVEPDPDGRHVWAATSEGLVLMDATALGRAHGAEGSRAEAQGQTVSSEGAGRSAALARLRSVWVGAERFPLSGEALVLEPGQGQLRFELALPVFRQVHLNAYRTWLEGWESNWTAWQPSAERSFSGLPPGQYRMHFEAKDAAGLVHRGAPFEFTQRPPWYQTPWARLAVAALLAGLVAGSWRFRSARMQRKQDQLEALVEQRTGEIAHKVHELGLINSIQASLVQQTEVRAISELVGEQLRGIFNSQICCIRLFERDQQREVFVYAWEDGRRLSELEDQGFAFDAFSRYLSELKEPLLINQGFANFVSAMGSGEAVAGELPLSALYVPIRSGSQTLGVVSLQDATREHAFTPDDVRLLSTLTSSMSVVLQNARLFEQSRTLLSQAEQRAQELATVNRIVRAMASQIDLDALLRYVGDQMRDIFKADICYVALLDEAASLVTFPYYEGDEAYNNKVTLPYGQGLVSKILQTGEPILINRESDAQFNALGVKKIGRDALSYLGVAISSGDKVIGVVSVQSVQEEGRFDEDDTRLLSTMASNVGVAIHTARLFAETRRLLEQSGRQAQELRVINAVQQSLVADWADEHLFEIVGEKIREVFAGKVCVIRTFDAQAQLEYVQYVWENGQRLDEQPPPGRPLDAFRSHLLASRSTLVVNEDFLGFVRPFTDEVPAGEMPRSALYVPLIVQGEVMGNVSLQDTEREHAFSPDDVRVLNTLANSLSVALENAALFKETDRLLRQTQQRAAELATLNEISAAIAGQLDLDALFVQVGESMRRLFNADIVYMAMLDEPAQLVRFTYYHGRDGVSGDTIPYGHGLVSKVLRDSKPILISEGTEAAYEVMGLPASGVPVASYLGVPIVSAGQAVGVISVQSENQMGRFVDTDLKLLETLAAHVGVAIRNARLFEAEEARHRELEQMVGERTAALQEKNAKVAALLDHVRQAIFSVDAQLRVQDECSRACEAVLGRRPMGETLETVLFPDDPVMAAHVQACLSDAAQATDARRKALFLSLIPQEVELQGKSLRPEVVALDEGFMFAVSDHTDEKAMQAKLQTQRQGLEMVVSAVSDSAEFFATVQEFEDFVQQGASAWDKRSPEALFRSVHTFKGSFSQLGFTHVPAALHEVEEGLRALMGQAVEPAAALVFGHDWLSSLERDLEVIRSTLGASFVRDRGVVALSPADAPWVQQLARDRLQALPPGQPRPQGLQRLSHLLDVSLQDELRSHERMLQRVASQRGKQVDPLQVEGETVWLEPHRHRAWLSALSHVFRNAIDHGIEAPEAREEAGKPEAGRIDCVVGVNAGRLTLSIADDGAGVNETALREKVARLHPQAGLSMQDMMLMDGISTRETADELSGRGVGLAALNQEVQALGGCIRISTQPGQGTRITLEVPL